MDLKGTQTAVNLMKAFAGECQARMRYTYFSSKAKAEGYVQIAAIFEETANHEKEHAKRLFKFMTGGKQEITDSFPFGVIGSTVDNLQEGIDGERYENTVMYPTFAKVAKEEGFAEISEAMAHIAHAEKYHENRYAALKKNILAGTVFKKSTPITWKCRNCGYTTDPQEEAPTICPACAHPQAHFEVLCDPY
jgi:rubrerythrin